MEINAISKGNETSMTEVLNPEGSLVFGRLPEVQLYLEASNLKIKFDSFYNTADEKLEHFIILANEVATKNPDYVLGLAKFLADNGLKLSPVVLLSVLSNKNFSFRNENLKFVFNTPQRIAEAVALSKKLKLNNSFKKHVLKISLENMNSFTLRKNKMLNRKVKLKDLIKLLRPKPQTDELKSLYKAIIENSKDSKMKETETFVRVKSSKELSKKDKAQYFVDNIEKMPINELIRNLKFIDENFYFEGSVDLQRRVIARLNSINDLRFLNIFDLIEAAIAVPQLEKAIFEIIRNFTNNVKEKFNYNEDVTVLFDASGSMQGDALHNGFKYLVLFSNIFNNVDLRFFGNRLWPEDTSAGIIPLVKSGHLKDAFKRFSTPDGTSLLLSTRQLLEEKPKLKTLIVISDEVSWGEGSDLTKDINEISSLLKEKNLIIVNPKVYCGTVFKNNVLAFASLTSTIIYNIMLQTNQNAFIKEIKQYKKSQ
jgi:hypothetical protein